MFLIFSLFFPFVSQTYRKSRKRFLLFRTRPPELPLHYSLLFPLFHTYRCTQPTLKSIYLHHLSVFFLVVPIFSHIYGFSLPLIRNFSLFYSKTFSGRAFKTRNFSHLFCFFSSGRLATWNFPFIFHAYYYKNRNFSLLFPCFIS